MIKGIFVTEELDKEKIDKIQNFGFDSIFTNFKNLNDQIIALLKEKKFKVFFEIGVFPNLCPNDQAIQQEKLTEIKKLMDLQTDGIWLDFIRFPLLWEIKNPDIKNIHLCSKCRSVKNRAKVISNFVARIRGLMNQRGKNITLGMFSVPWENKDFNGAIKKVIGQDFNDLAKYIDIFSPMVYHKMCGKQTSWIHEVVSYMKQVAGRQILPIVQTENKPEEISKEEFRLEINNAIKSPSDGVIVFFWEDLLRDEKKVAVVNELFRKYRFNDLNH